MSKRLVLTTITASALLLGGCFVACQKHPSLDPTPPGEEVPPPENKPPAPVVLAAGDIGNCSSDGDEATAALLDQQPGTVLVLGDSAYPTGSASALTNCYEPSWGRHKARTRPVPGNHEYLEPGAAPYYDYFGEAAGERGKGYYSFDLGTWHLVALNSELQGEASTEQQRWLREDLKANPTRCTLAYMHRPLFTSIAVRNNGFVRPLWEILAEAGAEVMVTGHDHFYERFAPQTPQGQTVSEEQGIRQFVVGTGGTFFYPLEPAPLSSRKRIGDKHGVLKLTLEEEGYTWEFLQTDGDVGDQGRGVCH
ncbi:metallophosphoesterase family protein [Archangium primigenium]|uniref:metallophosphoesterase family protein n=1 Tax=[Archangium] primigenium TaxID=2792470 RepID=UPI00195657E1|nr:metallophosphoesterase [Archangium primigenium]MBM7112475.1 metallophosphoesterase [Archangium primigenium]